MNELSCLAVNARKLPLEDRSFLLICFNSPAKVDELYLVPSTSLFSDPCIPLIRGAY